MANDNSLLDIANNGAALNQALSELTTNVAKLSSITLPASNGGTGLTAPGASGNVLTSNGTTWQSVALSSSGVTSVSFGTTGLTPSAASSGAVSVAGTLNVSNGGTGLSSLTAYGVLCGGTTTTGAAQSLATGSSGQVLTSSGSSALPQFQTLTQSQLATAFNATGTAPFYACRAWVNFNGLGTIGTNQTIRGSGNVSSVFKNAAGDYTITFTTPMPDANYAVCGSGMETNGLNTGTTFQSAISLASSTTVLAGSVRILNANIDAANNVDGAYITVTIFR